MRHYISLALLFLTFFTAKAQTSILISSGITITNSGTNYILSTTFPGPTGSFVNNGTFTDVTSPDSFIVFGDFAFSGTGTTTVYNFSIRLGLTTLNSIVTANGTVLISSGDSLAPNGNLTLASGAVLINNGYLSGTNSVVGLVTNATATSGACPFSPTLSHNVSGSNMVYQWQSSPNNSSWTNVASGGTSATYSPTVITATYYRCMLSTTTINGGYSQATPGLLITPTGPTISTTGSGAFCTGGAGLSLTASGAGAGGTYTWTPTTGLSASTGATITATPSSTTTYTVTGITTAGCSGTATANATVNPTPTPSFTTAPTATTCEGTSATYSTQSGQTSYVWNVPGTAGTDYVISSGGIGSTNNTVTLAWYTSGSKTVTVNYTSAGCTGATAASNSTTIQMAPAIASVTPLIGLSGSTATITGTGFNSTAANNIVFFGATRASVTAASTTSLTVTVPSESNFADVTVNNNTCGLVAYSPKPFLPTYNNTGNVAATVNFDPIVDFASGGNGTQGAVIIDIDGDGKADVLGLNQSGGNFSVFRNTATAGTITTSSLATPVNFTTGPTPSYIAAGDLDGDGKPDVAVSNYGNSTISVYLNTSTSGAISFAAPITISVTNPQQIRIADIDGDGRADLTVGVLLTSSNISVFRNTSTVGSISFASAYTYTLTSHTNTLQVGDIDGDGKPDVVACDNSGGVLFVIKNTSVPGTISLTNAGVGALAGLPVGVELVDIDGDGKLDIVYGNTGSGATTFTIIPNTSTPGSFSLGSAVTIAALHTLVYSIKTGDIDGDSKPDIIVSYNTNARVGVYRNTSTAGSFTLATEVEFLVHAGTPNREIAVGDLDGDGKADLVTTGQTLNSISILRNDPLQPITGTSQLCLGGGASSATLTEASAGGTWSSSNPAVGSVGSTTGVVTGVASGVAVITFSGSSGVGVAGNFTTYSVTVTPAPAISGTLLFPTGTISQLSATPTGGTWLSVTSTVASIGIAGLATGLTTGNSIISYTANTCTATATVTVNTATSLNWYSTTTGGDASVLSNWWSTNSNNGYQPTLFSTTATTWNFQSNMTSTAALTLAGNVAIVSGGTFTPLASSTTTVGGNWRNTGGTFTHNSGTVLFDGSNGVSADTVSGTLTSSSKFNHLTFNSPTATYTFLSNAADVAGNYLQSSGTVTAPSSNLNIAGNFSKSSGSFKPNSGTVTMNGGSSTLTVTGMTTPVTNCFHNLSFNAASSATYSISTNLVLTGSFTNLTSNGTMALGSNTLTVGGNWTNPGPFTTGAGHNIIFNGSTVTVSGNQ